MSTILLLLSGGLDSSMLLYDFHHQRQTVHCLLFDYGQRHVHELDYARRHCAALGVSFTLVELGRIQGLFARSSLTDGQGGKVVPNRNAVLLNIAASIAVGMGIESVAIAVNRDDRNDFPDCRPEFFKALNACLEASGTVVRILTPYAGLTKWQIVQRAKEHGWPFTDTLSCYTGNSCGECDACRQRAEALR